MNRRNMRRESITLCVTRQRAQQAAQGRRRGSFARCTDRDAAIIDFCLYLAAAVVTICQLIQRARTLYRWDTRPTNRRLK